MALLCSHASTAARKGFLKLQGGLGNRIQKISVKHTHTLHLSRLSHLTLVPGKSSQPYRPQPWQHLIKSRLISRFPAVFVTCWVSPTFG